MSVDIDISKTPSNRRYQSPLVSSKENRLYPTRTAVCYRIQDEEKQMNAMWFRDKLKVNVAHIAFIQ